MPRRLAPSDGYAVASEPGTRPRPADYRPNTRSPAPEEKPMTGAEAKALVMSAVSLSVKPKPEG